jgi:hypothetical protein
MTVTNDSIFVTINFLRRISIADNEQKEWYDIRRKKEFCYNPIRKFYDLKLDVFSILISEFLLKEILTYMSSQSQLESENKMGRIFYFPSDLVLSRFELELEI